MSPAKPALPGAFWRQFAASLISNLGDGVTHVAMPLLVLSLTDDARVLALATTAAFLPWIVMALPVGVAVDRYDRQRLMIGSNAVRTGLLALIAAGAGAGWLEVWPLLMVRVRDRRRRGGVRQFGPGLPAAHRHRPGTRPGERTAHVDRVDRRQRGGAGPGSSALRHRDRAAVRSGRSVVRAGRGAHRDDRRPPHRRAAATRTPRGGARARRRAALAVAPSHVAHARRDAHRHQSRRPARSGRLREVRRGGARARADGVRDPARHDRDRRGDRRHARPPDRRQSGPARGGGPPVSGVRRGQRAARGVARCVAQRGCELRARSCDRHLERGDDHPPPAAHPAGAVRTRERCVPVARGLGRRRQRGSRRRARPRDHRADAVLRGRSAHVAHRGPVRQAGARRSRRPS